MTQSQILCDEQTIAQLELEQYIQQATSEALTALLEGEAKVDEVSLLE